MIQNVEGLNKREWGHDEEDEEDGEAEVGHVHPDSSHQEGTHHQAIAESSNQSPILGHKRGQQQNQTQQVEESRFVGVEIARDRGGTQCL